ncbi:hypothetical protein ABVK25_002960 [Lepraria finkii]|uniref:Uncharacterized protein n=1 Tax=Lepraria finkii TaxID=1340010 RepID=A0ABR4BIA9_9LECA
MASIKQEPLSDDQWDQLMKNFAYDDDFPDHQNTTLDQDGSSITTDQSFVTSNLAEKSELPQMDWTFMNPADQSIEMPANNGPKLNLGADQVSSRLDEIKALLEENSRQISRIHQHLAGLHPFFHGMRETLKALTIQINPEWEVQTPTTPVNMQYGKSCD